MARTRRNAAPAVAAPLAGAALIVGLATLDAIWGPDRIIAGSVVIGPFLAVWLGGTVRTTVALGLLAVVTCLLSGTWNDNFGTIDYLVRVMVVAAGAVIAAGAAEAQARLSLDRRRFAVLSVAAEVGRGARSTVEAAEQVRALLIPEFADTCEIELGGAVADAPGLAPDRRTITVPLRPGDRPLGTMRLHTGGRRRYSDGDAQFVGVLAGRVALALENAGLVGEVAALETRLSVALGSLDEAVTIQDAAGRMIYANDAAARDLGAPSPEALVATPPEAIAARFDSFHEDGTPLRLDDVPSRKVLAGEPAGPLLVRAIDRATGQERWRRIRATAVAGDDGRPEMVVNVIEDVTDVKRAEVAQRFLADTSALLAASLDHEETLRRVARLAVPELADWCSVSMPDDQGYLRPVAVAHSDPARLVLAQEYNRRFAVRADDDAGTAQVLREGAAQLVNDITDELLAATIDDPERLAAIRELGLRAVIAVPMVAPRGIIGVISFVSAESGRRFSAADLELAEELGRRAGTAVDNARLHTERSYIARTLQTGLLPDALPDVPGFVVASMYRPAGEENLVGGDFYDVVPTPQGWMVVVGDVTGRGAAAAALTGQARHTIRTAAALLGDPVAAVEQLNRALAGRRDLPICTVAAALLGERDGRPVAEIVCAGHPQPLRVRGGVAEPVGPNGPMVGAWANATWSSHVVELEPGDLLALYTDGVTDAVGPGGRFGAERLAGALCDAGGAQDAVLAVQAALERFEHGAQADDTAVLVVECAPPASSGAVAA